MILRGVFILLAALLLFCPLSARADENAGEKKEWWRDWSLEEGFDISIDTEGYHFPSALAFVPDPGKDPKDPLYFVLELRGKIKVVTNDRSVYTFAEDFFKFTPSTELPAFSGENGLAGICLDPENGYVFVTFAYQDESGILRNNIARFDSKPGTFSLKPGPMTAFTDIFSREGSSPSHQIGPCRVYEGALYVAVGDGFDIILTEEHDYKRSQSPDSVLGKILRMTLDGKPLKSNPYYVDDDVKKARNYVWAVGLRNPFGLTIADGHVFVADNGPSVDRIIEVREGGNYLWDGTDTSFATNSLVVFVPGAGITQLVYLPPDSEMFPPPYIGKFYVSQCGDPDVDPKTSKGRNIEMFDYDFRVGKVVSPPATLLRYTGSAFQTLAGLAIGPDGLYIVPILPLADGRSVVLKVTYNPESTHPNTLGSETSARVLLESRGCYGCHTFGTSGWGTAGPNLDSDGLVARVTERLGSGEYRTHVKELEGLETEPYKSYREERAEVLDKSGIERVRTWMKYHIMEPKFDNPESAMPNLGINEKEAELITMFLVPEEFDARSVGFKDITVVIPHLRYRHIVYSFLLGIAVTLLAGGVYAVTRKRKRMRA
ncbi:MAG: PQQ-dependent sugar dehydrogenase [Thermodesulfobacteriota bacterium]